MARSSSPTRRPARPPTATSPTNEQGFGGCAAPNASSVPRSSAVLQELVESRGLARLMVAFCTVGCAASCAGIKAGSQFEVAVLFVEVRGDRFAPRDVFVDLGQCGQPCGRAVGLADCDRTVEPDDRSVGELE